MTLHVSDLHRSVRKDRTEVKFHGGSTDCKTNKNNIMHYESGNMDTIQGAKMFWGRVKNQKSEITHSAVT